MSQIMGCFFLLFGAVMGLFAFFSYQSGKKFEANCIRGKAVIEGFTQQGESDTISFLVRLTDYDNECYNCSCGQKIKLSNYPKGTVIDVDYLPGDSKRVTVNMVDYPPVKKTNVGYALGAIGAVLFVIGIILIAV